MRPKHQNDTLIVYLKQPSDWKIIEKYGIYRIRSWIKNPPEILENRSVKTIAFYLPSIFCLLYTSPSPRDRTRSRMPSSA